MPLTAQELILHESEQKKLCSHKSYNREEIMNAIGDAVCFSLAKGPVKRGGESKYEVELGEATLWVEVGLCGQHPQRMLFVEALAAAEGFNILENADDEGNIW